MEVENGGVKWPLASGAAAHREFLGRESEPEQTQTPSVYPSKIRTSWVCGCPHKTQTIAMQIEIPYNWIKITPGTKESLPKGVCLDFRHFIWVVCLETNK